MKKINLFSLSCAFLFLPGSLTCSLFAQNESTGTELKSIEEVIEGIDSLLGDIERSSEQDNITPIMPTYPSTPSFEPIEESSGSFRVQNELMPNNLLDSTLR